MKLRELTLRNYRVFAEPPAFEFQSEDFTVVAGINGRGKTALLDGLAVLLSHFLPQVSPARTGYRPMSPSDIHLELDSAALGMKLNCAGIPIDYRLVYDRERQRKRPTRLPRVVRQEVRRAYETPSVLGDTAPIAVYYTTDRAGVRLPKSLPKAMPRGRAAAYSGALVNRRISFLDFMRRYLSAATLEREERSRDPDHLGDRAVDCISRALTTFLGGFDNLRVQANPLRLLVDKDGDTLDLSQLSDGERSFLATVCDLGRRLAIANPRLTNPLHGTGLVLIDELELHLHPRWQREVRSKLKNTFPNVQFVATTHSPFIIQALRPGELINLHPEELGEYANQSIEDITETVMGVPLPQRSQRYIDMMHAAETYYRILHDAGQDPEQLAAAEQRLNELSMPFSDDPAFHALLKLEREVHPRGNPRETD